MSENDVVQGQRGYFTEAGEYNRLRFVIEQVVREMLNTASKSPLVVGFFP